METEVVISDKSKLRIGKNMPSGNSKFTNDYSNRTDKSSKLKLPVYSLGEVEIPQRMDVYNGKLPN